LAAFERPFLRSQSTACSRSPLVSVRAVLQSIMPAPVLSRSSFTWEAEMLVIACPYVLSLGEWGVGGRERLRRGMALPRPYSQSAIPYSLLIAQAASPSA